MQKLETQTPQALLNFLMEQQNVVEAQASFGQAVAVQAWQLTEAMGVQQVEAADEAVLYITKGKVVFYDAAAGSTPDETNTYLLGAGEPFHKKSGNHCMLYACKGDCELYVFRFEQGTEQPSAPAWSASEAFVQQFQQVATKIDDYYFGYDERYAQVYEAGADLWESDQPNQSLLSIIAEHNYLLAGRIVDLGCGEGRDSLYLAEQGYDVTGVDVSRAALTKARERAKRRNLERVRFIETNVIYLRNMTANSFDFAMNMGCLHMLTDAGQRSSHLQRVFDILKPGGHFLVDHCQENWGKGFYSIPDYDKVAKDLVPGKSIPRRIRVEEGEKEIELKVLPFAEKKKNELIAEICTYGFEVVDVKTSDTEAFGNSAVLLFKKP